MIQIIFCCLPRQKSWQCVFDFEMTFRAVVTKSAKSRRVDLHLNDLQRF